MDSLIALAPHTPREEKSLKEKGSLLLVTLYLIAMIGGRIQDILLGISASPIVAKELICKFNEEMQGKDGASISPVPGDTIDIVVSSDELILYMRHMQETIVLHEDGSIDIGDERYEHVVFTHTQRMFVYVLVALQKQNSQQVHNALPERFSDLDNE